MQLRRDGNFARLVPLAIDDANDETLPVDVLWLDAYGFAEAETALVDNREVGAVSTVAERAQQLSHLFA